MAQVMKGRNLLLRTIGIIRVQTKIELRNLAYTLGRFGMLVAATSGCALPKTSNEARKKAKRPTERTLVMVKITRHRSRDVKNS